MDQTFRLLAAFALLIAFGFVGVVTARAATVAPSPGYALSAIDGAASVL